MAQNYSAKDVLVLVNGLPLTELDGLNLDANISIKFNEDRAKQEQYVNGGVATTFNSNTLGTITFSIDSSSVIYSSFLAFSMAKTTFPIVIKDINNIQKIALLDNAVIMNLDSREEIKNKGVHFANVVFSGKLTML